MLKKKLTLPKLPDKHKLAHKGESFFHGSYLTVELFAGHGILSWLAGGILLCIIVELVIHSLEA